MQRHLKSMRGLGKSLSGVLKIVLTNTYQVEEEALLSMCGGVLMSTGDIPEHPSYLQMMIFTWLHPNWNKDMK